MTAFRIAMGRVHFSREERDAGYCHFFVENLSGVSLSWFSRLKANFIDSFHKLSTAFLKHYSMFIQKEASNADLWTLAQGQKESLRAFIERFKKVVSRVKVADDAAIAALRNALWYESRFRDDLMLNTPPTLEDVMHIATIFIEVEEEMAAMARKHSTSKRADLERQTTG